MIVNLTKYDGHLLHNRFAYQYFGNKVNPLGDIIAFRGEMEVLADAMIDQEDLMAEAFIWSDDAVNFLWELPVLSNNAFGAVAYQRLFNSLIADILSDLIKKPIELEGDDIMVLDNGKLGKASVSITHVKQDAALGHTGINVFAGTKAPGHAYSCALNDEEVQEFMQRVCVAFYALNQDVFVATSKVIN
jgi:hypothetical protein